MYKLHAYLLTNLLTYLLTPCSRVLLKKLTSSQLVKKFPAFYGTPRFITAFTSARHLSLSWASLIQSIPPHPNFWRSILMLSSHLRLGLPSGLFPSGFPTKLCIRLSSLPYVLHAPPNSFFSIWSPEQLGEQYRSLSSSQCSFLLYPVTSSLLGPNILLSTPFFKHPQPTFLPQCERASLTPIRNNRQNYSSVWTSHTNTNIHNIDNTRCEKKPSTHSWPQYTSWQNKVASARSHFKIRYYGNLETYKHCITRFF